MSVYLRIMSLHRLSQQFLFTKFMDAAVMCVKFVWQIATVLAVFLTLLWYHEKNHVSSALGSI